MKNRILEMLKELRRRPVNRRGPWVITNEYLDKSISKAGEALNANPRGKQSRLLVEKSRRGIK